MCSGTDGSAADAQPEPYKPLKALLAERASKDSAAPAQLATPQATDAQPKQELNHISQVRPER